MDQSCIMYIPPAKSKVYLSSSICHFIGCKNITLRLANKKLITANSWVFLLSKLFSEFKSVQNFKNEVVLPRHSCYEFTKAILDSKLKPVYFDLEPNLGYNLKDILEVVSDKTLAIVGVSNLGVEVDFTEILEFSNQNKIYFVEDATYSFLGVDSKNKKYGYIADYAILNFSEGKSIPIGGGGVLISSSCNKIFENPSNIINQSSNIDNIRDFFKTLIYQIGSSPFFYTIHKKIKSILNIDFKRTFSMEPTRNNDFQNLKFISKFKKSILSSVLLNNDVDKKNRYQKYIYLKSMLKEKLENYSYSKNSFIIKVPVIIKNQSDLRIRHLSKLGVQKLYSENSPLFSSKNKFKNSNFFYKNLYTIPVHSKVKFNDLKKISDLINEIEKN